MLDETNTGVFLIMGVAQITDVKKLSASMQDYLEAILELEERGEAVRVTDIANKLQIAKPSVNQTLNKFKKRGLVRQEMYGPVELTSEGRNMAEKIRQTHQQLKRFLIEVLNVEPQIAEEDACRMEHAVSAHTMERLTEFLSRYGYSQDQDGLTADD